MCKLSFQSKQQQVEDLLARADQLVSEQKEQNDILVYEAMAESLGAAWKELNRQLELRGYILSDAHHLHELADEHQRRVKETNTLLREVMSLQEEGQQIDENAEVVTSVAKNVDGRWDWAGRVEEQREKIFRGSRRTQIGAKLSTCINSVELWNHHCPASNPTPTRVTSPYH